MTLQSRCILFDLDGTLVDTAPDLAYAANCVRSEAGLAPLPVAQYRPVASAGARGLLKVGMNLTPEQPAYAARRDSFLKHYRAHLSRESRLFPGMDETLAAFETKGIRWGVVTNKPQWLTDPLMAELNLSGRAACVVGAAEGIQPKPAPDSLLRACHALALSAVECVYVGDDRRDVVAARAAGMPVIAVAWGYLGEGESAEEWQADAVIRAPGELLRICA